tara:strand:+ start:956 stop:1174 length:219 start_codon:yes stop_codon:yes gene_type:complete
MPWSSGSLKRHRFSAKRAGKTEILVFIPVISPGDFDVTDIRKETTLSGYLARNISTCTPSTYTKALYVYEFI